MRRAMLSIFLAALFLLSLLSSLLWYKGQMQWQCRLSFISGGCSESSQALLPATQGHQNIAVVSEFIFHFDVYLALVWSLARVMNGSGSVQVYAHLPFYFDFQTIVDGLRLYHGTVKHPADLIHDIENTAIDMVVIGTCEVDIPMMHDWLLAAWDARDDDHKFQLVCIAHHQGDQYWHSYITSWARRHAIRILTISEHVSSAFWKEFKDVSASINPILRSAGYELVPVDTFVPILNLSGLPDKSGRQILSSAVIQGSFDPNRRSYFDIFEDLIRNLHDSPASWGYLPLDDGISYIPDTSLEDPPFKLYLVGSDEIEIPPELKNIVTLHVDLNYTEYYGVMAEMDICLPAFGPSDIYYVQQASSTAAMCLEVNVPMLVTQRLREAYTHLDDDRVSITYPAVMTEIDAIRALRTQDASAFLASDPSGSGVTLGSNSAVREAVEEMLEKDWIRTSEEFEDSKREVWAANDLVVMKLLQDDR